MTRETIDSNLNTSVTDRCRYVLSGTRDMKRVTAALRQVILPTSPPTLGPAESPWGLETS
jgi:hypothetical protein